MGGVILRLAVPLLLVAVLASALGFFVTRTIAGDRHDRIAQVSVVGIPPTPTPTPSPTPPPTPPVERQRRTRGSSASDPRCPSGCECSFPSGGTVIVCQGDQELRIP